MNRTAGAGASVGSPAGDPTDRTGLSVSGLTLRYGVAANVLGKVSLDAAAGGITALLGRNGAGKTTLLRAVGGSLPAHGGQVLEGRCTLNGVVLDSRSSSARVRSGVAHVPQGRGIFRTLTVEENLRVGLATRPTDRRERRELLQSAFDIFPPLHAKRSQLAGLMSGGQQQMLAVARGLMARPSLLLLDEPTLGLAPRMIEELTMSLREVADRTGAAILLAEENATAALAIASRCYVIAQGGVALEGSAEELRSDARMKDLYLHG